MNCKFGEKVSAMLDGELSMEEVEETRKHIADCEDCKALEDDFLFFRKQIKEAALAITEAKTPSIHSGKGGFGSRVSIPVPAFALAILLLIGLISWQLIDNWGLNGYQETLISKRKKLDANKFSLSRYDKGGKAEIYVLTTKINSEN